MLEVVHNSLVKSTRNLLENCAGCEAGQSVLFIHETETDGYYDPALPELVAKAAKQLGYQSELYGVALHKQATQLAPDLVARIERADCAVFLARLGDQIRFRPNALKSAQVICHALDCEMMGSPFGETEYHAFAALEQIVTKSMSAARDIHVTCPAGTDYRGSVGNSKTTACNTALKRFPLSVFKPVSSKGFTGHIAQKGFLTGTGSSYYTPWTCEIRDTLFVRINGSYIQGFDGTEQDVKSARAHYEYVGRTLKLDTYAVHSWHAGIHPGLSYKQKAARHFERWSGGAFGNPRILHLHTCGREPPGEISLNVLDPTVRLDGVAVWENGRLFPERLAGGAALLSRYPEMKEIFDNPRTSVGQSAGGRLSYR